MHDSRTIGTEAHRLATHVGGSGGGRSLRAVGSCTRGSLHCTFAWLIALVLLASLTGPARGEGITGRILSVGLGGSLRDAKTDVGKTRPSLTGQVGTYRWGTWVPVLVELKNGSQLPQQIYLSTQKDDLDGDKFTSISPPVSIGPDQTRLVWLYYWPPPNDAGAGLTSVVVHDKPSGNVLGTVTIPGLGPGDLLRDKEVTTIFPPDKVGLSNRSGANNGRFVLIIGQTDQGLGAYRDAFGGNAEVVPVLVRSMNEVPEKALGLDGVDLIVWNPNAAEVSVIGNQDFQRKAILDWVRSGGHLIVVAGTLWQQLAELDAADVLPVTLSELKDRKDEDVRKDVLTYFKTGFGRDGDIKLTPKMVTPLQARLKPGARAVRAMPGREGEPLAYSRAFGAGVVTLLTLDVSGFINEHDTNITDGERIAFWNRITGYRGDLISADERQHLNEAQESRVAVGLIGTQIPLVLDVASVTQVRLLLAVLFLAVYWVFAGPGGHGILRAYKRTHWSWWIFGGVVAVAAMVAFAAAFFLRVTRETVRHHTYVLGTADVRDASVVSYYGVLSPSSGMVNLSLPEGTGESWLAPFNQYVTKISEFPPRRYQVDTSKPTSIDVPFRSTLKRMQARWYGPLGDRPLISGELIRTTGSPEFPLKSTLVNNTGVTLEDVTIVYLAGSHESDAALGSAYILRYPRPWIPGTTLELSDPAPRSPEVLEGLLEDLASSATAEQSQATHGAPGPDENMPRFHDKRYGDEFLSLFAEALKPERPVHFAADQRARAVFHIGRPYTRGVDRTNILRTMGAVLVARTGAQDEKNAPPPPLSLRLDGRNVSPSGMTIYAVGVPLRPDKPPAAPESAPTNK